jgi:leucyl aminopeptidase
MVENEFYIFTVDDFRCKFMPARRIKLTETVKRVFHFYSAKLGKDQIIYRIRRFLARWFSARANGIEKKLSRRHFKPYGDLSAVVAMFHKAAYQFEKYSTGFVKQSNKKDHYAVPEEKKPSDALLKNTTAILEAVKVCLPKAFNDIGLMIRANYPETAIIDTGIRKLKIIDPGGG